MIHRLKGALRGLVERLKASDMFKNVMRISSGTLLGQLILIATTPVMTRLYGAAIIGDRRAIAGLVVASIGERGRREGQGQRNGADRGHQFQLH